MTESGLRQTAIDVLHAELKAKRVSKTRSELALSVLTEMREAKEESEEKRLDQRNWQDFVKEVYIQTAIEIELDNKLRIKE